MFRGIVPFVAVGRDLSMKRAAARLGVSAAAVSKAIAELEARVGVVLLTRSARGLLLTREGALFLPRCQDAVAAVEGAAELLVPSDATPRGELRVSVPFVGAGLLAPALALLRTRYPQLAFDLTVTDRISKLEEESVDIAVRIGALKHTSLIARRLRRTELVTVASPAYVSRRGAPQSPEELGRHDCLALVSPQGRLHPFAFAHAHVPVRAALRLDHGPSLLDAALAGLGVAQLFDFIADAPVRDGKLVRVLASDTARGPDVFAVCAKGRRTAPKVRAAFDAFAQTFAAG